MVEECGLIWMKNLLFGIKKVCIYKRRTSDPQSMLVRKA